MNYEIVKAIIDNPQFNGLDFGPVLALAMRLAGQYMDAWWYIGQAA